MDQGTGAPGSPPDGEQELFVGQDLRPPELEHADRVGPLRRERECQRHVLDRSEEHTSELQSLTNLVCRLLLEKKKKKLLNHLRHNYYKLFNQTNNAQ